MIISAIHIRRFGKFVDFSMDFHHQMHIIEGKNEAGKSTLASFLRFMLYGFDSHDKADYGRGIHRESQSAEGTMDVVVKGKKYRIERLCRMEGKVPKVQFTEESCVTDLESGVVTANVCAGELFLGIPRSIFLRIASVGQLGESGVDDAMMQQSIENLLFSGDEKVNLGRAGSLLAKRKDALLPPGGRDGEIGKLKKKREALLARREEAIAVNRELLCSKAKLEDVRQKHREAEEMLRKLNDLDICYRNVQVLIAFDKLHDTKQKTNAVSVELLELKAQKNRAGFVPDGEYVTEIGINRRLYAESKAACAAAKKEWDEASKKEVIDEEIQRNLQRVIGDGGEEAVVSKAREKHHNTMWAVLFAMLTALAGVFCATLAVMMLPGTAAGQRHLAATILPACIFLLCAAADVGLWMLVRIRARSEHAYYISYGAQSRKEFLIRLRNLAAERSRASERIMRVLSAEQYYQKTVRDRDGAREMLAATLSRWTDIPDDADMQALADEIERGARTYLEKVAALKEEKNRLDATASQLRDQLVGQNEKAIRSKITKTEREQMADVAPEEIAAGISIQKRKLHLCAKNEKALTATIAQLEAKAQDPIRLTEFLADVELELQAAQQQYHAIKVALATFLDVEDRLKARITPRLASAALELVASMTDGGYDDLDMEDDLTLTLKRRGEHFSTEVLSAGTRDLAYMALRLAMIDMVCHDEPPPLCLDESFAYQDDERAMGMMKMLAARAQKGMQHLIFTCRPREEILVHRAFGKGGGYTRIGGDS